MKYYSEKLKKLFESEKDLILAEKEFDKKKLNSEKELKIKRQHDVEFAYSEYIKTVKEANKLISDASDKYIKLRNEFIKKYGFLSHEFQR